MKAVGALVNCVSCTGRAQFEIIQYNSRQVGSAVDYGALGDCSTRLTVFLRAAILQPVFVCEVGCAPPIP